MQNKYIKMCLTSQIVRSAEQSQSEIPSGPAEWLLSKNKQQKASTCMR